MLHEDYPIERFPKTITAHKHYAFYADLKTQRYALQSVTSRTKKRALVQCGDVAIYNGGQIPARLQKEAFTLAAIRHFQPLEVRSALFVAKHLVTFWQSHTSCPSCQKGSLSIGDEGELICKACHHAFYIPISPAVILGIVRKGKLLVTRYANRPYTGPALVAGYCAVGESLEETCIREALEETNLEIKGPFVYFGSQPWGLSNSLLMGFFVKATSQRKLILADGELAHADWLTPEECKSLLPQEGPISLTATMIKAFAEGSAPID